VEIVSRLLNTALIIAITFFAFGVGASTYEYNRLVNNETEALANCIFWSEKADPAFPGETIEDRAELCRRYHSEPSTYLYSRDFFENVLERGSRYVWLAVFTFLSVFALNYILFGKVTLWNRVESSPKEQ